ncbi:MAG: MFS transporter [Anaerolineae bacterium]|nr:MFS transporter [Anaerolineae bacterium]
MIRVGVQTYLDRVQHFQRNARVYLLHATVNGVTAGIFGLLFNFYVLGLGFDEALLGQLLSINNSAALIAALPAGYLSDRLGRKKALLRAGLGSMLAVTGMVLWPTTAVLLTMIVLLGLSQSLSSVTMAPFLMENSSETERTYLFSTSFGVYMLAVTFGYWMGGQLPDRFRSVAAIETASVTTYGQSLLLVAALSLLALIPLLFLHSSPREKQTDRLAPFRYARQHPALLGKLITPLMITTLGAGLFVPFMNIFFRETYQSSDATIGSLFATGSLIMALGLLVAPLLADRYGNIKTVILTQALSIPFMAVLGFAPWLWLSAVAYLARLILMNMTIPVYQAFAMEQVKEEARATASALLNMGYSFGYMISPAISGRLQVQFGFNPIFGLAILTYGLAIILYWRFFGKQTLSPVSASSLNP